MRGIRTPHAAFAARRTRRLGIAICAAAMLWVSIRTGAQDRKWPSEKPPRPLACRDVSFPAFDIRSLPNGLKVVVVNHAEQPAVSVRLIVRAGAAQDPPSKAGVAALAMSLLDQGTTTRSAQQVAEAIDSVGGELRTGTGRDLCYVDAAVMKDSFEIVTRLVADVVRNPAFAPGEIDRQRQQVVSALQVSDDDPAYVANVVIDRVVHGFHPYGRPGSGTRGSVALITAEDLRSFHDRYFAPNNSLLAVVGDVTTAEAMAVVTGAFGDWPSREIPPLVEPEAPPPARRMVIVDKPGAVQTEVRVGQLAIPRTSPDFLAMDVAIRILGGEGANRLQQVLRTERGLTYGAQAELETFKRAGHVVAATNTRSDQTAEVLRLVADEFARLRRERVSERELNDAKAYLAGNLPLTLETPDQIAAHVLNALFYELPLDELQTFRQRVTALTPDDISRVVRQSIRPDQLSFVLVGDADAFVRDLPGVGFGTFERVRLADLDLDAAGLTRSGPGVGRPGPPLLSRPR
jgi:zinc protease